MEPWFEIFEEDLNAIIKIGKIDNNEQFKA